MLKEIINGQEVNRANLSGSSQAMISDEYNPNKDGGYAVGDYSIHENALYKCKSATSGAWDSTKWELTNVGEEIESNASTMAKNGAHNLLPFNPDDLDAIKQINTAGTWSNNIYSHNGITFTINNDGTVLVDGTASKNAVLYLSWGKDFGNSVLSTYVGYSSKANGYIISDGISEGDIGTNTWGGVTYSEIKRTYVVVMATNSVSNVTVSPMIRLASDTNPEYTPYAMTNRELTEKVVKRNTIPITTDANGNYISNVSSSVNVLSAFTATAYHVIPFVSQGLWRFQLLTNSGTGFINSGSVTDSLTYIYTES